MGDGSLGMNIGEISTLARKTDSPIILVHLRNESFGWIKMLQKLYFDENYFGVDFDENIDYAAAASGLGARGKRVETGEDLASALQEGLKGGVTLLDVPVPDELQVTPPVHSWIEDMKKPAEERRHLSY
jgi:acetolactate synthase-1/2/3 large subunit